MGKNSKIEWTHHTFNPWEGCEKVSPACANCYAETWSNRWGKDLWGADKPREFRSDKYWNEPLKWNSAAEAAGERHRVFCASMSDVFEDRRDLNPHRERLWRLIEATPQLDWLLLTKRPQNVTGLIPLRWAWWLDGTEPQRIDAERAGVELARRLPNNVWIGATVEDQKRAEERIPHLLRIPAKVRFLSCEPLLEEVILCGDAFVTEGKVGPIDWVICGGESGSKARPLHPDWARSLRDQCRAEGVPFFFKQWGQWVPQDHAPEETLRGLDATDPDYAYGGVWLSPNGKTVAGAFERSLLDLQESGEVLMLNVGTKAAGRLLDGVVHEEFPS